MAARRPQLYGGYGNPDHLKVLITLHAAQVDGKKYEVHYDTREKVPFLLGNKRPFLEVEPGRYLFSANEICRYFLETNPRGKSLLHPKMDNDWIGWEVTVLKPAVTSSCDGEPTSQLMEGLRRVEMCLEGTGQFLCGKESFGLVDIVVWSTLYIVLAKEAQHSAELSLKFPNVAKWFAALHSNPSFSHGVKHVSAAHGYEPFKAFMKGEIYMPRPLTPTPGSDCPAFLDATPLVTPVEIAEAVALWEKGPGSAPSPRKRVHPILPQAGERNVLITSALPYVNNVPHLGNIIGCVLSADVYSRFCRLRNYNTLYLCGTDEYGTATETKALQEGMTPQELCLKYKTIHEEVYRWFNIDFDYFGQTSTPQQTEISQDIFWHLHKRGYITENSVDQLFCGNCSRFLADRFVEGTCPLCGFCDARGDQCDKCGRLINAVDLKNPRCKTCSNEPHIKSSDHLFLDLSQLERDVDEWSVKSAEEGYWSNNARVITSTWIRDGLKPRCISRDLKWGTPVPLEGYTDKVFYVWFDAPIGYLSITACYTPEWRQWWKNPSEVTLCQFMAKDNVPFHTVVFPATLIGAADNYTLLNVMSATEYLNYEEGKFSKSRGVGVFGNNAQDSGIPADIFRFYLLYIRPETQDTAFSWHDLMLKNNTDLLNNLGNFINRSLMFLKNNFASTVPAMELTPDDQELIAMVTKELSLFNQSLEGLKLRDGLKYILNISRHGNVHIQAHQPWVLVRGTPEERARAATITAVCANMCCLLSVMLQPYMPAVSEELQQQLLAPPDCNVLTDHFYPFLSPGHKIGKPKPLFAKIEPERAEALRAQYAGGQSQQQQTPPLHPKQSKPAPSTTAAEDHSKQEQLTPEERAHLEEELAKQAQLVRELKSDASGATKEKVDQEVEKLVKLKKTLGMEQPTKKKGKKK